MKKLTVFFFLICTALGEWQQSDVIALPKAIQVNDLAMNSSGELWILSTSSILKYKGVAKTPVLVQKITGGKVFDVSDEDVYVIDNSNQLLSINVNREGYTTLENLVFHSPRQIGSAFAGGKPFVIIQEPSKLTFVDDEKILGSINANVERFGVIPGADYSDVSTPLFTLANNRICSWTGGTANNAETYIREVIYSASNRILDFSTDQNGDLYILFPDSIVILETKGGYKSKVAIDNLPSGSKILTNPINNNILIYNQILKSVQVLTGVSKGKMEEIIILHNNRPNPVDNYTEIDFTLSQSLDLTITVYNLIGAPVKIIARGRYPKGMHQISWRADDENGDLVPNGIYFYRLESTKGVAIRQLTVLR